MREDQGANSVESALATLQPIRDLAKNWDIDIAACLEEYLHDLIGDLTEEERRNLPHQAETLNFSQAALVLQNSSNVYSRKVEYLYNLVYKAHEELLQSSGNKNTTNASRKASVDAAVEEFHSFDPNVEFLLLDDVLPTDEGGKKINLREDNDDEETSRQDTGISFATMGTHTRLSLGMTGITNMERSSAAHSATQHVLRGSLDNGSLRLIDGRCDVGEGGILIMPGAGNSSDSNSRRRSSAAFGSLSPRGDSQQHDNNPINNDFAMADNENDNPAMGGGFNDYDDHDDEGGGFDFAGGGDDDDDDDFDNAQSNYNPAPKQGVSSSKAATDEETKSKDDPWLLLDPHAQSSSASSVKPLRIGRTCKLPPAVSELPSECVTGARTKRRRKLAATTQPILEKKEKIISFLTSETFRARLAAQRKRNSKKFDETSGEDYDLEATLPEVPLTGLFFGNEFLYIAKATARQKNAQKRQEQKLLRTLQQEAAKDDRQGGDDDAGYAPFDFGGGDDDDGDGFGFANDDDDNDNGVGNNGVASMDDMFRNDGDENDANTEDGGSPKAKTFEELCRAHIQAFAKGAEAYATETRLTKRVGDWHERLLPILNEEENRPEFDIHEYTKRVVSSVEKECRKIFKDPDSASVNDKEEKIVDFGAVTRHCPHYEVCRLFLASLSLCNSGNIILEKHDERDETGSSLRMKLLNNVINRPMEEYRAPSLVESDDMQ